MMLASALEHYRRQQRITAAGLLAAKKARGKGSLEVARAVTAFQILAARDAETSVAEMLDEQGIVDEPVGAVAVAALAGTASDGRTLDTLFDQAQTSLQFGLMVATQLQDAARGAASVSIASRNRVGYVRMLNPPSCSRCAVLAGKWYGWNKGFRRHPRCDCRHVPTTENVAGDLTTNPDAYFRSLDSAEQDRVFTKAGAQAVRDGADLSQVVNARSGMSVSQAGRLQRRTVHGQDVFVTSTGTTVRGAAGKSLGNIGGKQGGRYRRSKSVRLMPESIYEIAGADRIEAQRLLRLHGYLT